ncbi:MAG: GYDIA family GHMP kinase [Bdellovibrionales bacterium]
MIKQSFRGSGKLLLTSEYFILDGAKGIGLPTKFGQTMDVETDESPSDKPTLQWMGYTSDQTCWINVSFDLETFDVLTSEFNNHEDIQNVLRQARIMNPEFLNSKTNINVKTALEFPNDWGLGSSSTLLYMVAKWAKICPFDLLKETFGGSGYDIACAGANGPLIYQIPSVGVKPVWNDVAFIPPFADNLYFVHQNKKQSSRAGVSHYRKLNPPKEANIERLHELLEQALSAQTLEEFETIIEEHEQLIGNALQFPCVKETLFSDYWGQVKSLGAWGGDFVLVTSNKGTEETLAYFQERGYQTILKYKEMVSA